jgi:hypothetical protein
VSRESRDLSTLMDDLDSDRQHAELFRKVLNEYPEELTMEIVMAALRRGLISAAEAVEMVRDCNFSFGETVRVLKILGQQRGWQTHDVVLEALAGQPH